MDQIKNRVIKRGRAKVSDFKVNRHNPKKHPRQQLQRLESVLDKFGQVGELYVYRSDRNNGEWTLFDGHARQRLDPKQEWDIAYTDLTDKDVDELVLYYDPLAMLAENLADEQMSLMADLSDVGGILGDYLDELAEISGFSRNGHNSDEGKDTEPQIDRAEELREKWQVELGQLWACGDHRIICGDCTDRAVVERVMGGEIANIQIQDPPYGIELDVDFTKMAKKGNKYVAVFGDEKPYLYGEFPVKTKEEFWFGADYYCQTLPIGGSWFVWDKFPTDEGEGERFGNLFEMVWSKAKHKKRIFRIKAINVSWQTVKEKQPHPTQKPVKLIETILSDYSKNGDFCLDGYCGSGTTLIACQNLSRQCRGIEIEPKYIAVTLERFYQHTGIEPVLLSSGGP